MEEILTKNLTVEINETTIYRASIEQKKLDRYYHYRF
jgi:hypothetical protein